MASEFDNIVLIVSDSLRFKDISTMDEISPFLSEVSESGLNLDKFYSNAPWTVPAHASLFSGKLPSEHGCTTQDTYFDCKFKLISQFDDRFCIGLSENGLLSKETGFSQDFDEFRNFQKGMRGGKSWKKIWEKDDDFDSSFEKYFHFIRQIIINGDLVSLKSLFEHIYTKISRDGFNKKYISEVFSSIQEELDTERDSFVFANVTSTHYPYTFDMKEKRKFLQNVEKEELEKAIAAYNHEEYLGDRGEIIWGQRNIDVRRRGYLASIRYVDKYLENLYNAATEDTVFIVVGDHGELFGEYQKSGSPLIGHHFGTFKELVHVPCFIFSKSEKELAIEEDRLYSLRDLPEIIQGLDTGEEIQIENNQIRTEYFGLKGYYDQFDRDYPEEVEELFSRKSFSLITEYRKFDVTSDGKYLWSREGFNEGSELCSGELFDKLNKKADILYSHYFDK